MLILTFWPLGRGIERSDLTYGMPGDHTTLSEKKVVTQYMSIFIWFNDISFNQVESSADYVYASEVDFLYYSLTIQIKKCKACPLRKNVV